MLVMHCIADSAAYNSCRQRFLHSLSLCMHCKSLGLLLVDLTVKTTDLCMLLEGTAQTKSSAPDPLDTERFASASDYSKGENITPAKAQLQTIIGREKQRVGLDVLQPMSSC